MLNSSTSVPARQHQPGIEHPYAPARHGCRGRQYYRRFPAAARLIRPTQLPPLCRRCWHRHPVANPLVVLAGDRPHTGHTKPCRKVPGPPVLQLPRVLKAAAPKPLQGPATVTPCRQQGVGLLHRAQTIFSASRAPEAGYLDISGKGLPGPSSLACHPPGGWLPGKGQSRNADLFQAIANPGQQWPSGPNQVTALALSPVAILGSSRGLFPLPPCLQGIFPKANRACPGRGFPAGGQPHALFPPHQQYRISIP